MNLRIRTRHHLTPRCRRNPDFKARLPTPDDVLVLYRDKHDAWHTLFKEATLEEAISLLQRVARMKGRIEP